MFTGDYHTHTKESDGYEPTKNSLIEAERLGLKELGVTDHGFKNFIIYSQRWNRFVKQRREIEEGIAEGLCPHVKIYHGIEADILDENGGLDLTEGQLDAMQILLAGFHPLVSSPVRDWFRFCVPIYWEEFTKKYTSSTVARNTKAAIASIKRYPIDIWVHPNELMVVDLVEVAKACADYGTMLEVNCKHLGHFDRNQSHDVFDRVLATGAKLIANTDGHKPNRIARFPGLDEYLKEHGLTPEIFENYDKVPYFPRASERSGSLERGLAEQKRRK